MVIGALGVMAGATMLTRVTPATAPAYLLGAYFLFGLGTGMLNPPITNTAVSGMPAAQAGVAAGVASTSRQAGMTLGVAAIGAIAGGGIVGSIGPGFAVATHPAWWVVVGLASLILALAVLTTTAWAEMTARRTAEGLRGSEPPGPHTVTGGWAPEAAGS
jgi:MFS family permease